MSPEERELLSATHVLATENNRILRGLRSVQRWQSFWSAVKWLLIIASVFGSYYYLQPYLDKILAVYQNLPDLQNLLPR
ncbi:hypothetical protein IT398_00665 [Candidatus Nomurabacteria bacterium]|nr:hypothetical protein [Candidatus Nomurabacteria bacterium]